MKKAFKSWLTEEYGLQENTANSRVSNIANIEKYYGDVDDIIRKGQADCVLRELSYSTDDERNSRMPAHNIPIAGNIRNGSATLKSALRLYMQYNDTINEPKLRSALELTLGKLKNAIAEFEPTKKSGSYPNKKDVREYIQEPLLDKLKTALPEIDWDIEYKLSNQVRDSIDIFGKIDETSAVIIEIDTVRSDQICKKFVSRQALSGNMNTIYIVLTYPNKNCMARYDRNALPKYGNYLKSLTNLLEAGSNFEKLFYIHNL